MFYLFFIQIGGKDMNNISNKIDLLINKPSLTIYDKRTFRYFFITIYFLYIFGS